MMCSEIMITEVECIAPEDSVQEAAAKMRQQGVGFLAVCECERKIVGTLTDRDIVVRLIAQGGRSSDSVSSIMSDFVVSCRPSTDVHHALDQMRQHQVSRIVCVDDAENVVGLVSLSDIPQRVGTLEAGVTLKAISARDNPAHN